MFAKIQISSVRSANNAAQLLFKSKFYKIKVIVLALFIALFQLLALPMFASAAPSITEFPPLSGIPHDITLGQDGAMWYMNSCIGNCNTANIQRITDSGSVSAYSEVTGYAGGLKSGPDGALWFVNNYLNKIGRMTSSGVVTYYSIPVTPTTPDGITGPVRIISGSDGALWFTDYGRSNAGDNYSNVGRVTTSGNVTIYSLPGTIMNNQPYDIAAGQDGALWFTGPASNVIGRITTSGAISLFSIPTTNSGSYYLTAGADGAIWFGEEFANKIGSITTSGVFTEYPVTNYPSEITSGSDGALWFTEPGGSAIGRITTSGAVTEYPLQLQNAVPTAISAGPNSTIWFTDYGTHSIGRIDVSSFNVPGTPATLVVSSPTRTPVLNWDVSSNATSYNIYRNGNIIGSNSSASFSDNSAPEGINSYYVTAVNTSGESAPSNTVSTLVDTILPTISYSLSPASNSNGWNNTDVSIGFICGDSGSGVSSCSSPITLTNEGANQVVTGQTSDYAGNNSSVTTHVSIDKTSPAVNSLSFGSDPLRTAQTTTLSANLSDSGSGLSRAEYYTGADPGVGNGLNLPISNSVASALVGPYLTPGMYTFYVRALDNAGNWSQPQSINLDVYNPLGGYAAGHGSVLPNSNTSNAGDNLPTVSGANVKANFDFTVKYATSTSTVPTGPSTFTWGSGNCKKANNSCFVVTTDSLSWLVVPGDNSAIFQGYASLALNGQSLGANYPVRVTAYGTTATYVGQYKLQVFQIGSNPDSASPIYQASGDLSTGSIVLHP